MTKAVKSEKIAILFPLLMRKDPIPKPHKEFLKSVDAVPPHPAVRQNESK